MAERKKTKKAGSAKTDSAVAKEKASSFAGKVRLKCRESSWAGLTVNVNGREYKIDKDCYCSFPSKEEASEASTRYFFKE